ncbi:MAG: AEC family transporter [Clostridiales bacterium]|nr:AEC family transporter [Clostridiales bacterium]
MTEFKITLDIMLPLLIMLGLGWLIRHIGLLSEGTASAVNKLIFRLFLPVLLFNNIRTLDISNAPGLGFSAFIFFSVLGVFLAAHLLVPRFVKDPRKQGVMVQGIFRTNFAILGIPLVQAMFGDAGKVAVTLALPIVTIMNNVLAVIALASPSGRKADVKALLKDIVTNPLIIACVLGGVLLLSGVKLPTALDKVCNDVGGITSPLSLIVLGASLHWKGVKDNRHLLLWTVILKQGLIPVVMLSLAVLLGFRHEELGVMLVLFGAPCAVSSYPMAEAMGGDGTLAASQVVLTTIFSMGTLFVLIYVGKLIGVF